MARKAFNTTIDENIQNEFKAVCAKKGLQMNEVLELFMKGFINGEFKVVMIQKNDKE